MSGRTDSLVAQFQQTHQDFVDLIRGLSPEEWQAIPANEQRPVNAVAYHTAEGYLITLWLGRTIANGEPLPGFKVEGMHQMNAQQAEEHAGISQEEVLDLLNRNAKTVVEGLKAFTDEQLSTTRNFFGSDVSVQAGLSYLLVHHVQEHGQSIRSVVQELDRVGGA